MALCSAGNEAGGIGKARLIYPGIFQTISGVLIGVDRHSCFGSKIPGRYG